MAKFKSKIAYLLALFVPVTFSQEDGNGQALKGIHQKLLDLKNQHLKQPQVH